MSTDLFVDGLRFLADSLSGEYEYHNSVLIEGTDNLVQVFRTDEWLTYVQPLLVWLRKVTDEFTPYIVDQEKAAWSAWRTRLAGYEKVWRSKEDSRVADEIIDPLVMGVRNGEPVVPDVTAPFSIIWASRLWARLQPRWYTKLVEMQEWCRNAIPSGMQIARDAVGAVGTGMMYAVGAIALLGLVGAGAAYVIRNSRKSER